MLKAPRALLLATTVLLLAPEVFGAPAKRPEWGAIFARLLQLEHEYVEVMESPTPEQVGQQAERAAALARLSAALQPRRPAIDRRIRALAAQVSRGVPASVLAPDFHFLKSALVASGRLAAPPEKLADLSRARTLFQTHCASCHGADGRAQTPLAQTLSPPPVSFHESDTMNPMSPFTVFHVLTYGEEATAMPSFAAIDEADRWALAFYVFSLRHPCEGAAQTIPLRVQTLWSDNELAARYGEPAMWCARATALTMAGH